MQKLILSVGNFCLFVKFKSVYTEIKKYIFCGGVQNFAGYFWQVLSIKVKLFLKNFGLFNQFIAIFNKIKKGFVVCLLQTFMILFY